MLVKTKGIAQLMGAVLSIYLFLYVGIAEFNIIGINNLRVIKYVVPIIVLVTLIVLVAKFWKRLTRVRFFYIILSSFLILVFISSIFVFKIEDLFFWNDKRRQATDFFEFSRFLLGLNYILALPYLGILILETVFIINSRRG